ncbi:mitochondrial carrier, partial [Trematosphaeria pertusa]
SWAHLIAGASGGMATAILTSPLDVLRTRLQADFYRSHLSPRHSLHGMPPSNPGYLHTSLRHIRETFQILFSIQRIEGWRGLFRGLGPGLTGVVPASAIKFYTYGNCKRLVSETMNWEKDAAAVYIIAAATAGVVTGTATNPIWLVKTRLQLDKSRAEKGGDAIRQQYRNSFDCVIQVLRQEGFRGLYRSLSASYLGAAE